MKKIKWKEIFKFLSGAFLVTAGASWYFAWYKVDVPFMGTTMSHEFLAVRGFFHFALFLLTLYFGYIRKSNSECNSKR
jgi:membrane-anchored protein YejM (alkaline phosphatase superfamily)